MLCAGLLAHARPFAPLQPITWYKNGNCRNPLARKELLVNVAMNGYSVWLRLPAAVTASTTHWLLLPAGCLTSQEDLRDGSAHRISGMDLLTVSQGWICSLYLRDGSAHCISGMDLLTVSQGWICSLYLRDGSAHCISGTDLLTVSQGWICSLYLRDGSAHCISGMDLLTVSQGWICSHHCMCCLTDIKVNFLPHSHIIVTPSQPAPALTLYQAHGRVATGLPI